MLNTNRCEQSNKTLTARTDMEILYKELSYKVVGAAISVRKRFGLGHKEQIYQKAFEEELERQNIGYVREPSLKILSPLSGKYMGVYRPDFLVENKIIVEFKVQRVLTKASWLQLYQYLRISDYKLAYLINFSQTQMTTKRVIFTKGRR